jgi:hypothetical protein
MAIPSCGSPVWVKTSKAQNEHMLSGLPPAADLRLGDHGYVGACLIEVSYRPYLKSPNWYSNHALRLTDYEWPAMRPMLPNKPHSVRPARSKTALLRCSGQAPESWLMHNLL